MTILHIRRLTVCKEVYQEWLFRNMKHGKCRSSPLPDDGKSVPLRLATLLAEANAMMKWGVGPCGQGLYNGSRHMSNLNHSHSSISLHMGFLKASSSRHGICK